MSKLKSDLSPRAKHSTNQLNLKRDVGGEERRHGAEDEEALKKKMVYLHTKHAACLLVVKGSTSVNHVWILFQNPGYLNK